MKTRRGRIERKTRETNISVELAVDGSGSSSVDTGLPFMNHMLELMSKHSLLDMKVRARGDIQVDYHHTVEDLGLALGSALDQALGERKQIVRYGWCLLPMDESLAAAALDLGGRPYLVYETVIRKRKILDFDVGLIEEFFRAFTVQARMNLHVAQLYGKDPHHAYEAMFKAVARALGMACAIDPRVPGVPSSKGRI